MDDDAFEDAWIDAALGEAVGGEVPPDVAARLNAMGCATAFGLAWSDANARTVAMRLGLRPERLAKYATDKQGKKGGMD